MPLLLALAALAAAEPVLLDAGHARGAVLEGFAALGPDRADDPRARWLEPPFRSGGDVWPDPLAGDWVMGGRLHLDLPPGRYVVRALLGRAPATAFDVARGDFGLRTPDGDALRVEVPDTFAAFLASPHHAVAPRPVFRPGASVWERQIAPAHPWREAVVEVGDDGLTLHPFGRPLQALAVAPADEAAALDDLLARADAARRAWFHTHLEPEAPLPPAPPADGPPRVQVAAWHEGPDPARAATTPALDLALAPGERLGRVLWLFPGAGPGHVAVDPPRGVAVELYEVSWLDTAGAPARPRRPRPEVLIPTDGALEGGQGLPVGVAVVLRAADDAAPGARRGTLRITRGDAVVTVPLRVRVRRLDLPPPPASFGVFVQASPTAILREGFHGDAVRQALDADLARVRRLGMDTVALRMLTFLAEPPASTALAEHAFATWARLGGREVLWLDPKERVRHAAYVEEAPEPVSADDAAYLSTLLAAAVTAPVRVVIPWWEEEAWKSARAPASARRLLARVRPLAPLPTAALMGHPVGWDAADAFDRVLVSSMPTVRRAVVEAVAARKTTVWAYNQPAGRAAPWATWASGAGGLVQWHWNAAMADPFADVHPGHAPWYAAHGPDGQVWHTVTAERYADGIVDLRYAAALEHLVRRGARSARGQARQRRAEALLEAMRTAADGVVVPGPYDGEVIDPAAMEAWREAAGALLDGRR